MSASFCYIVGAGERTNDVISTASGDLLIAADGGYTWLKELGLEPDVLVGDFDSLAEVPALSGVVRLPKEKDDTDTMFAVRLAMERGYHNFRIYGGAGGRFDHTLANLQILSWLARRGCGNTMYGTTWMASAITDGELCFPPEQTGMVSVFCQGDEAAGVYLEGLKYPLTNATLTCDYPLGVSNEFTGGPSRVTVGKGTLLVVWER